ncbi:hypothetical protein [Okeania sp. SIO2B9]|uniref:hypothetical protein n=1 Tax=Okeania sp. SIO2B9 TaxID=2607782 RepID=UPI0035C8C4D1
MLAHYYQEPDIQDIADYIGGLTSGIFSFFIPLKGEAHTHNLSVKHPQLIEETQIHNGMLILPFCLNFIGCF